MFAYAKIVRCPHSSYTSSRKYLPPRSFFRAPFARINPPFGGFFLLRCRGRFPRGLTALRLSFLSRCRGRFQSKQRERATTSVALLFFCCDRLFVSELPSLLQQKKVKLSFHLLIVCIELFPRIELGTSSLPRKCSTTELKQHLLPKSGTKVQRIFLLCNFFVQKNRKNILLDYATICWSLF